MGKFECANCEKVFSRRYNLNRHARQCAGDDKTLRNIQRKPVVSNSDDKSSFVLNETTLCDICGTTFQRLDNLRRHLRLHRQSTIKLPSCSYCHKQFSRTDNLLRHLRVCSSSKSDMIDIHMVKTNPPNAQTDTKKEKLKFTFVKQKAEHLQTDYSEPGPSGLQKQRNNDKPPHTQEILSDATRERSFMCRKCNVHFPSRQELYKHQGLIHFQTGGNLKEMPFKEGEEPWTKDDGSVDSSLKETYDIHKSTILKGHDEGTLTKYYNFSLAANFDISVLMKQVNEIYNLQDHAFRINFAFGIILKNTDTGNYRYYKPYFNQNILPRPMLVSRLGHLDTLRAKFKSLNLTDYLLHARPNTKYQAVVVTNILYTVTSTNFILGTAVKLPYYIKKKKSIICLDYNKHTKQLYTDHMCMFRCLYVHLTHKSNVSDTHVNQYFKKWKTKSGQKKISIKNFKGITSENELNKFEETFKVNINIFELQENDSAICLRKSLCNYKTSNNKLNIMNLNLYNNHLSYIKKISTYTQKHACRNCSKMFKTFHKCKLHEPKCSKATKYIFPGGFYSPPKTIFEKLEEFGIVVDKNNRFFDWFISFDMESLLIKLNENDNATLKYTQYHHPVSVSICSNVDGYRKAKCFIDSSVINLIKQMKLYMTSISNKVKLMAFEKWETVLHELNDLKQHWENKTINDNTQQRESNVTNNYMLKQINSLIEDFEKYCCQCTVLGFNSGFYDLNLCKKYLAQIFEVHESKSKFTVKKNNKYLCLCCDQFRFLDLAQYLPVGTSYKKFLDTFHISETKGFFPYDYFDNFNKLNETELPPIECFYSSLHNCNTLEKDYIMFNNIVKKGKTIEQALKQLDLISVPQSKEENYKYLKEIWHKNSMKTFRDFLIFYNNRDVKPFVSGVEKLQSFYHDLGVDMFKDAISIPGIARRLIFQNANENGGHFAAFDEANRENYFLIKRNIFGGPSIVTTRYAKAGETFIRNNPSKICEKIYGWDCNAMYLWALCQEMPCGPFVVRKAENNFKPIISHKYTKESDWIEFLNKKFHKSIIHKMNWGKQKRIGPYLLDGYDPSTKTVYEFHCCFRHGHMCSFNKKGMLDEKKREILIQNHDRTEAKCNFLRKLGYSVVELYYCEFLSMIDKDKEFRNFIESRQPPFVRSHRSSVSEEKILKAVRDDKLFGMLEVDISIPEHWSTDTHSEPPLDHFSEFPPIFCTTDIPFEKIGNHMINFAKRHGFSTKSRRLLIGALKAQKILLATPLIKFYLEQELCITRIYRVIEFTPKKCFENFGNTVTQCRRKGDEETKFSIVSEIMKLLGNASYGSMIMAQENHKNIEYVSGKYKAAQKVNSPRFQSLTELDEDFYEIEMSKSKIKLSLPVQVGFFVLNYAKLRLLHFYYDFLLKFCSKANFEFLECDTDSAYVSIAGRTLDSIIKPDKKQLYNEGLYGYCQNVDIKADNIVHWFPRGCCAQHSTYDRRVLGLYKVEFSGNEQISLCSKTYLAIDGADYKLSCKGVNKHRVKEPYKIFKSVLNNQKSMSSPNVGFQIKNNVVLTYNQQKNAFSYFYCKRRVLFDGIHTVPLDIVAQPSKRCMGDEDYENDV